MESILLTIKKMLGLDGDYAPFFDVDIIVGINAALMDLTQLGVGPKDGFVITGQDETWNDFVPNRPDLEGLKLFIFLKTRLMFDPPSNSFTIEAIERRLDELTWRLNINAERGDV